MADTPERQCPNHGERHAVSGVRQERSGPLLRCGGQVAIKFGARTADSLAMVLGAVPAAGRMDQVGVAIMECDSGAELLPRRSESLRGRVCADSSLQVRGG